MFTRTCVSQTTWSIASFPHQFRIGRNYIFLRSIKVLLQVSYPVASWTRSSTMSLRGRNRPPGMIDISRQTTRVILCLQPCIEADRFVAQTAASWQLKSPRTPLESLTNGENYQYCHLSGGRRLFPSRRTITPVLTPLNTNARHCYSPFEVYSSPIKAHQNEDDRLSKDDSPSSTGSVKIGLLSTLDLPPLEAETSSVHDNFGMGSSRSIAKLRSDQASPPPTECMSPPANVVESMKQPPQIESLSVLKHHPYDHRSIGDSESGQGSQLEQPNSSVKRKPQTSCLVDSTRSEHHASVIKAQ